MAFTRKFLKTIGLTDEQIESVMEEHVAVTDGLKAQVNTFKGDAEKLPEIQKELDDLRANTADYDDWKNKYTTEHDAFEQYKTGVEKERTESRVKSAYRALLKAQNIDDKRIDSIIKVTDFTEKKLDKDGKFENESNLVESIKNEWKDFVVTTENRGAPIELPPANTGKVITKEEIMKIKDANERQKAIADNPELFGI